MFAKKLNFLMEITKTQNNMLAAAVNLDASHISRLRHGTRKLPKNQTYLMPIARYFARQIRAEYQKKILADAIGLLEAWPQEQNEAAALLYNWLAGNVPDNSDFVASMIQNFSGAGDAKGTELPLNIPAQAETQQYYYGVLGKREAVLRFLTAVANTKTPQTLLLFSDEELSWLYEDKIFSQKWAALLQTVLLRGNRIKIIHTVSRDFNELLEAVSKWIPIYATGAIEPYYYPKLRDGLFQRTLFIAPKTAAIISTSVQQKTANMLNTYIDDKKAIAALIEDFQNYLQLCRPLMHIYSTANADAFRKAYLDFLKSPGDLLALRSIPCLASMPQSLIDAFGNEALSALHQESTAIWHETLQHAAFTELLMPPDTQDTVMHADMFGIEPLSLTKAQQRAHIQNLLALLQAYPNYEVTLSDQVVPHTIILAKENHSAMMINTKPPYCTFAFHEQNMVDAFWDYLSNLKKKATNKEETIKKLRNLL